MTYAGCLAGSVLLYRVLFHRLRGFPGPKLAAISKLWHVYELLGPKELTALHPDAVAALNGPNSRCTKSAWYDHLLPLLSLGSYRAKGLHSERW